MIKYIKMDDGRGTTKMSVKNFRKNLSAWKLSNFHTRTKNPKPETQN